MSTRAGASPAEPGKQGASSEPARMDSAAVTKRLQQELMGLMSAGSEAGVSAFPQGDSLFQWVGTITVSKLAAAQRRWTWP